MDNVLKEYVALNSLVYIYLTWKIHVDYILKKANSRLFSLRLLKKAELNHIDLITIYRSVIRSILEYASPVWADLPDYLCSHLESVQKRALKIIFPGLPYCEALKTSKLKTLECRREESCQKFINSIRTKECINNPLYDIVNSSPSLYEHDCSLRNLNPREVCRCLTERLSGFITNKYNYVNYMYSSYTASCKKHDGGTKLK